MSEEIFSYTLTYLLGNLPMLRKGQKRKNLKSHDESEFQHTMCIYTINHALCPPIFVIGRVCITYRLLNL